MGEVLSVRVCPTSGDIWRPSGIFKQFPTVGNDSQENMYNHKQKIKLQVPSL